MKTKDKVTLTYKTFWCHSIEFMNIFTVKVRSNLPQDHNLDSEVSPKETEAKDEANTLALLAPRWKFL